jgi:5'-3' exonuclease
MGIKLLNTLIKSNCQDSCKLKTLFELKNKTIVVDISIYMYRFKSNGDLMENIYLLCSIFNYYNIDVLFIFDGVPPKEKNKELKKRKEEKKRAREEFDNLKQSIVLNTEDKKRLKILQKIFTTVSKEEVINVKKIIKLWGMTYITAEKEADELCAKIVICGKAYACMSEDTDLFVYGCPRVLRYLSIRNHTVVMYDLNKILNELNIDQKKFRKICIISGTDYNNSSINIFRNYNLYKKNPINLSPEEAKVYDIFTLEENDCFDTLLIKNDLINKKGLIKEMEKYNFIFV